MTGDMKCEILDTLLEFPEERGYHLELNLIKWGITPPNTTCGGGMRTGRG